MNLFKSEKVVKLEKEVERLNDLIVKFRNDKVDAQIDLSRTETNHRVDVENLASSYSIEVAKLQNEIKDMKDSFNGKVERATATEKKDLKRKESNLDALHAARTRKLELEHAEKIARSDRKLEEDKASYRKYLRTETNSKMDVLEKDNDKLFKDNAGLSAVNEALSNTNAILTHQADKSNESVAELTKAISTLSGKIADGLVKAVPTVTADFNTPEFPENHVHVEVPAQKGGNNNQGK